MLLVWIFIYDRLGLDIVFLPQNAMQIFLPPEVEAMVQRQVDSGKYTSAIEVILAAVELLEQQEDIYQGRLEDLQKEQEDIYQGRLEDLQKEARIGWEASLRGKVVDGSTAMAQIRANLQSRHGASEV